MAGHLPAKCPEVNPTHVGMDRLVALDNSAVYCKPHARGDGPNYQELWALMLKVNPTHVGMDQPAWIWRIWNNS